MSKTANRFCPEVRERAVRLGREGRGRQQPARGHSDRDADRMKALGRESRELRRANETRRKGETVKAVAHRGAIGSSPMGDGSSPLANAYLAMAELDRRST